MTTIEGRLAALEEAVRVHGLVLRSVDDILTSCMENELDNYFQTARLNQVTDDLERNVPRNEYGHTEEQAFMMARAFHILRHDQCPLADAAGNCQSFSWSPCTRTARRCPVWPGRWGRLRTRSRLTSAQGQS